MEKEISFENSKSIMLDILKTVHNFCVTNNIKYSLYAGTLLGAIRHNGFIPWDDDIDILMPRKDYEFFVKNFKNDWYDIITPYNSKEYYLPWAKVFDNRTIKKEPICTKSDYLFGIDIDIFPMDFIDSQKSFEKMKQKKSKLNRKRLLSLTKFKIVNPFKHPKNFILEFFYSLFYRGKQSKFSRKIDKLYQKHNSEESFLMVNSLFGPRPLYKHDLFDSLELHKFESEYFYIFSDYDYFLTGMFGNYMKLPPKEKQVTHHINQQYYK